jgi:plasmid stabilization system protein ParE
VTPFRVVVTDTAERHLETIRAWWTLNRRDAPLLFIDEIEAAFERISRAPHSGTR